MHRWGGFPARWDPLLSLIFENPEAKAIGYVLIVLGPGGLFADGNVKTFVMVVKSASL